jgi:hypothetical protein
MLGEHRSIVLSQHLDEIRRPFDVGEEESHRLTGQLDHVRGDQVGAAPRFSSSFPARIVAAMSFDSSR